MKFIQKKGYFKSEEDKESNKITLYSSNDMDTEGDYSMLLIDRKIDQYNKNLNLAILDLCSQCFGSISVNKKEYNSQITEQGVTLTQAYLYRELSRFLGYMGNCHSFNNEENNILDYDKAELLSRLKRVEQSIKSL